MEPGGEISSAPRTIDSWRLNNSRKQNTSKEQSKCFDKNANNRKGSIGRLHEIDARSDLLSLLRVLPISISSPILTIKVAEMSASQIMDLLIIGNGCNLNVNYHCEPSPRLG